MCASFLTSQSDSHAQYSQMRRVISRNPRQSKSCSLTMCVILQIRTDQSRSADSFPATGRFCFALSARSGSSKLRSLHGNGRLLSPRVKCSVLSTQIWMCFWSRSVRTYCVMNTHVFWIHKDHCNALTKSNRVGDHFSEQSCRSFNKRFGPFMTAGGLALKTCRHCSFRLNLPTRELCFASKAMFCRVCWDAPRRSGGERRKESPGRTRNEEAQLLTVTTPGSRSLPTVNYSSTNTLKTCTGLLQVGSASDKGAWWTRKDPRPCTCFCWRKNSGQFLWCWCTSAKVLQVSQRKRKR